MRSGAVQMSHLLLQLFPAGLHQYTPLTCGGSPCLAFVSRDVQVLFLASQDQSLDRNLQGQDAWLVGGSRCAGDGGGGNMPLSSWGRVLPCRVSES